jgi:putative ABC transport system permease protein
VLLPRIEAEIRALDAAMPLTDSSMMREAIEGATGLWGFRLAAYLSAFLGLVDLPLALVGVYGVVSYTARQRTREIGIRMALGGGARDVVRLVLGRGAALVACGVLVGVAGAWTLARLVSRVSATIESDPVVFLAATAFVAAVALWACYRPARRATRLDPIRALRHE